jgi:hypothetical protein
MVLDLFTCYIGYSLCSKCPGADVVINTYNLKAIIYQPPVTRIFPRLGEEEGFWSDI